MFLDFLENIEIWLIYRRKSLKRNDTLKFAPVVRFVPLFVFKTIRFAPLSQSQAAISSALSQSSLRDMQKMFRWKVTFACQCTSTIRSKTSWSFLFRFDSFFDRLNKSTQKICSQFRIHTTFMKPISTPRSSLTNSLNFGIQGQST